MLGLVALAVVMGGCAERPGPSGEDPNEAKATAAAASSAQRGASVDGSGAPTTDASPVVVEVPDDGAVPNMEVSPAEGSLGRLELSGMYRWNPEGGFHNAQWSGTFTLDKGCVYLDVSQQDHMGPATRNGPLRVLVRLPELLTRSDASTGEVWVGEHGPMFTGDEVVVVGSEGWPGDPPVGNDGLWDFTVHWEGFTPIVEPCWAHASLFAASMRPAGDRAAGEPPAAELAGLGLFAWDPEIPNPEGSLELGWLVIEEPCVYFELAHGDADAAGRFRFFLHLPRPAARFDHATGSLWYGDYGPIANGDKVNFRIGYATTTDHLDGFLEAGCAADGGLGEREYWGVLMEPCDSASRHVSCGTTSRSSVAS
ncbi:MAG: hypothetical protein OXC00_05355 [Acidimicrobiaceae bacterium]|nr:hypothetical protein [Acidimicrobiaceae bacterium]